MKKQIRLNAGDKVKLYSLSYATFSERKKCRTLYTGLPKSLPVGTVVGEIKGGDIVFVKFPQHSRVLSFFRRDLRKVRNHETDK